MLTRYSYRYSIEGDVEDRKSFDVSTEQLLNLSENTQAGRVCITKQNGPSWSAHMLFRCCRALRSRSLHSHPSGVFCSHHGVPSLLVPELLWSANQNEGRRSERTNPIAQNILLFSFSLCSSLCDFVRFFQLCQNHHMWWNYKHMKNKGNMWHWQVCGSHRVVDGKTKQAECK